MPGINDAPEQVEKIVELADGGRRDVDRRADAVPARLGARDVLRLAAEHRPDLVPRYEQLYRSGAYLAERASGGAIERAAGLPRRAGVDGRARSASGSAPACAAAASRSGRPLGEARSEQGTLF